MTQSSIAASMNRRHEHVEAVEYVPQTRSNRHHRTGDARQLPQTAEVLDAAEAYQQAKAIKRVHANADVVHGIDLCQLVAVVVVGVRFRGGRAGHGRATGGRGMGAVDFRQMGRHASRIGGGELNLNVHSWVCGSGHIWSHRLMGRDT